MEISTASRKVEDEEEEAEREELASGDWVSVSVDIERWNLLVCQLTDLQALARFIANLTIRTGNEKNALDRSGSIGISVVDFLSFRQGAASKVLSQFITQFNIPASHLGTPRTCALKKVDSQMMSETGNEDQPEVEPESEVQTELEGLGELRLRFPHSLNQDVLWCHCVMALVSCWNNNKEETNNVFLALEHLRCIHSPVLQNGLAVIIWKRYLKDKISATVMLMEKVCIVMSLIGSFIRFYTVDLSYVALEQLIKATLHLLELIVEIEWADSEAITLETEDFWHVGETNSKSLVDEAQEQPPSNASLVELHAKLVIVLWIIIGLEMKSVKPLSLFDTTSKESFMRDFSCSSPVSASEEIDKAIIDSREKFLTRALSVTVSSMTTHTDNNVSEAEMDAPMKDWSAAIYKLAEQFGMDADSFKRHFVRELYSVGFDELAKESMLCVRDQRLLASQLLRIVGQRLAHVILDASESNERAIRLSRLPTQISSWIKTQDPSKLACRTVALSHTVDLLRVVMSLTPEDSPDYPLTSELADSMKFLL
ncbi:PREDICTED: rab3 GTPase-activating protein non-catalytic subunit-like [Acropora digitifera]|uniref:rab3 GTPase-activating protein non-catalytic subunit-like n=1 Tax=Acropora digitifera TaxID=70779 RepID=UPI00077AC623|nr:PREDICTED: rab3 GTPase-activating protein non-catalytic subunit-like [Acropora digitifera]